MASTDQPVDELVAEAVARVAGAQPGGLEYVVDGAASLLAASADRWPGVSRALLGAAERAVGRCWAAGWQPADLVRVARRELGPVQVALAVDLIAAEGRRHPVAALDRRWQEQLRELDARPWWPSDEAFLPEFAARHRLDRFALATAALELLRAWALLPPVQPVGPVPGRSAPRASEPRSGEPRMLGRIRALLAKAESTGFPDEAEALTAKAQELMARHSIDEALLAAGGGRSADGPAAVRIGVDNPYEGPKTMLLDAVAAANRCRVVWAKEFGFCTVVGFDADLDAVELLYTSLLVQATAAMHRAGSRKHKDGAARTKAFRQSFLVAYAARIRERLAEATERATEEAVAGRPDGAGSGAGDGAGPDGGPLPAVPAGGLLPVLAARAEAVDDAVGKMFPKLVSQRVRVSDGEGWVEGRAAADRASLHRGSGRIER
ncbi:DUF2786 domain-containing protein [Kitasatospora sp. YST-16]|uniref:DUF2786 domain-containing protein n=1 Tax=unclassified Kitasatospora TaxID=2633591 RepID=UPI0004C2C4CA|nr:MULTISPECIES: DUF2786 domain-containing protein [unclassified Kitasatospora]WAL72276.1 DUF2786 domain-containing protein [Kitasatospora sp. YST-16]WNW38322.1 DUF2786 domain-containing protein [Streptomyces sp. Li-HN-5-13]